MSRFMTGNLILWTIWQIHWKGKFDIDLTAFGVNYDLFQRSLAHPSARNMMC